ncbi:MAG: glycosyltransferase family 4 protein [Armatimonadetes bacterium]|nr:glycosyltransferase family 4 protein [Armatimonadota bacterium]
MKPLRILHCPVEIAGQMWILSKAERDLGHESNSVAYFNHHFEYPCDRNLGLDNCTPQEKKKKIRHFIISILFRYDIFHFHYMHTLNYQNHKDLPLLKLLGKKIIMHCWGDDVRRSEVAGKINPYHRLMGYSKDDKGIIEGLETVSRYADAAIISNHELYDHVKGFFKRTVFVPPALNVGDYEPGYPVTGGEKTPLVVHAPSDKGIKGTEFVLEAVRRLKERLTFEFKLIQGLPHQETIEIVSQADIVIDQLLLGEHGLVTLEAMALGKPVISYIREDLIPRHKDFPIVNGTIENLDEKMEMLLSDPVLRSDLGRRGRAYVEEVHDSRKVAQQLIELYRSL